MANPVLILQIPLYGLADTGVEGSELPVIVRAAMAHLNLTMIHPFSDGNGRMGRLWQTLVLSRWQPMLAYLPVETVIKGRQADYYRLLGETDRAADCTAFIVFLLDAIHDALQPAS